MCLTNVTKFTLVSWSFADTLLEYCFLEYLGTVFSDFYSKNGPV
jgi:hypothetical protein